MHDSVFAEHFRDFKTAMAPSKGRFVAQLGELTARSPGDLASMSLASEVGTGKTAGSSEVGTHTFQSRQHLVVPDFGRCMQ